MEGGHPPGHLGAVGAVRSVPAGQARAAVPHGEDGKAAPAPQTQAHTPAPAGGGDGPGQQAQKGQLQKGGVGHGQEDVRLHLPAEVYVQGLGEPLHLLAQLPAQLGQVGGAGEEGGALLPGQLHVQQGAQLAVEGLAEHGHVGHVLAAAPLPDQRDQGVQGAQGAGQVFPHRFDQPVPLSLVHGSTSCCFSMMCRPKQEEYTKIWRTQQPFLTFFVEKCGKKSKGGGETGGNFYKISHKNASYLFPFV